MRGAQTQAGPRPSLRGDTVRDQSMRDANRMRGVGTCSAAPAASARLLASAKLCIEGPKITGVPAAHASIRFWPAEWKKRAADDRDIGRRVVERHLAHRVAEKKAIPGKRTFAAAAAPDRFSEQGRDGVEPLG
jgi:hypothetical protein